MAGSEGVRSKIMELRGSLPVISEAMAQASELLFRVDQAKALELVVEDILHQVQVAFSKEMLERLGHFQQSADQQAMSLLTDLGSLLLGRGVGHGPHRRNEHPPFGRVRITVGPGGIPDELTVVNVSRLARAQGWSEAEVERSLTAHRNVPV